MAKFFKQLENDFNQLYPNSKKILELFSSDQSRIINDHIALRTFDYEPISIDRIEILLNKIGYKRKKKL